jgi:hypothetical protein
MVPMLPRRRSGPARGAGRGTDSPVASCRSARNRGRGELGAGATQPVPVHAATASFGPTRRKEPSMLSLVAS